jgi:hypothetical protein
VNLVRLYGYVLCVGFVCGVQVMPWYMVPFAAAGLWVAFVIACARDDA